MGSCAGDATGGAKKRGRGANTTNQSAVRGAGGAREVAHSKSIVVLLLEAVKHLTEQQGRNEKGKEGRW